MNRVETIADIVAKIRAAAYCQNADSPESVFRLADRIEAAWKHERNEIEASALEAGAFVEAPRRKAQSPGNAAKIREALCNLINASFKVILRYGNTNQEMRPLAEATDNAREALAAPARNCDRFADYGEAIRAFEEASDAEDYEEMADWLFAPAAGGKGSEARNV